MARLARGMGNTSVHCMEIRRDFEAGVAAEQGHADKEQVQRVRDLFYRQLKVGHWLAVLFSYLSSQVFSLPAGTRCTWYAETQCMQCAHGQVLECQAVHASAGPHGSFAGHLPDGACALDMTSPHVRETLSAAGP